MLEMNKMSDQRPPGFLKIESPRVPHTDQRDWSQLKNDNDVLQSAKHIYKHIHIVTLWGSKAMRIIDDKCFTAMPRWGLKHLSEVLKYRTWYYRSQINSDSRTCMIWITATYNVTISMTRYILNVAYCKYTYNLSSCCNQQLLKLYCDFCIWKDLNEFYQDFMSWFLYNWKIVS